MNESSNQGATMYSYKRSTGKVIIPTVHLNGTSKEDLLKQLAEARAACSNLMKALENATPHDRDYYVQGPSVGAQAREDHVERMKAIENVQKELAAIYRGIYSQGR